MKRDYYIILGVSKGATTERIKRAYREMAKKYHPDSGGTEVNETKFREIQNAYDTLSDTNRRAIYDEELARRIHPFTSHHIKKSIQKHTFFSDDPFSHRSFVDEFFDGLLVGHFASGDEGPIDKELAIEMILNPSEAQHGGLFPLRLPVFEPCTHCGRSGMQFPFICTNCRGHGYVQNERSFSIGIPPNIPHGTEVIVPLDDIGLKGVNLYVYIRIEAHDFT